MRYGKAVRADGDFETMKHETSKRCTEYETGRD